MRYISPLARAQKLEDVTAIERYGQNIMQLAQAYPDVLDNMDSDEASKVVGEALGVPAKVMRSADEVEQLRQQRQQMQQQQAQQQMLMQAGTESRRRSRADSRRNYGTTTGGQPMIKKT